MVVSLPYKESLCRFVKQTTVKIETFVTLRHGCEGEREVEESKVNEVTF